MKFSAKFSLLFVSCLFLIGCSDSEESVLEAALNQQTQAEKSVALQPFAIFNNEANAVIRSNQTKPADTNTKSEPVEAPVNLNASAVVLSPNGKQVWSVDRTYSIRWEAEGVKYLEIALYQNQRLRSIIASKIPASENTLSWTPEKGILRGQPYINATIVISDAQSGQVLDRSDAPFLIQE